MTADSDALIAANPFPGLRSFKPAEADRFFGRQQQIDALVARLARTPLLAVSGASGCGKSSLVLAGLLNELARRHADDDETDWRPVVMRPGNRPIANLAAALAGALVSASTAPEHHPDTGLDAAEALAETEADAAGLDPLARRAASLYGQLRLGGRIRAQPQIDVIPGGPLGFVERFIERQADDVEVEAVGLALLVDAG